MFQLRPYQAEAKQAILAAWDEGYRKTARGHRRPDRLRQDRCVFFSS